MRRIGASDDELQLRTLLVFCAIGEGRLADAADELARMNQIVTGVLTFGPDAFLLVARAELALASGDLDGGVSSRSIWRGGVLLTCGAPGRPRRARPAPRSRARRPSPSASTRAAGIPRPSSVTWAAIAPRQPLAPGNP